MSTCTARRPTVCPCSNPETRKPPRTPGRMATSRVTATGALAAAVHRSVASSWVKTRPSASRLKGRAKTKSLALSCPRRCCMAATGRFVRYSMVAPGLAAIRLCSVSTCARLVRLWSWITTTRWVCGRMRSICCRLSPTSRSSNTPPTGCACCRAARRLLDTPENRMGVPGKCLLRRRRAKSSASSSAVISTVGARWPYLANSRSSVSW